MNTFKKGEQSRQHILDTALQLFAEQGYHKTTLRDIARQAGISIGLTYRYFARKEELIAALYEHLTQQTEAAVQQLPKAPMAQRFVAALRLALAQLQPHRQSLGALFGAGLDPESELSVLGDQSSPLRQRVYSTYLEVIQKASDPPAKKQAEELATLFYSIHLSVILFWLQDRSPEQQRTQELLDFTQDSLKSLRFALMLPPVSRSLTRLIQIIGPMFAPAKL
ncbi:MAG: TetR/AcrR family transcriptional regulator [Candidatus Eremiobacteraeota bacterium]|nr:TetR/AcrR family transcriptional regulator [Candidatus Eremiobacteraeota bacterium]